MHTAIYKDHQRIRGLMLAVERAAEAGFPPAVHGALMDEIDDLTRATLRRGALRPADTLLQIDLAVPLLEGAHGDVGGGARDAIEAALVVLAAAAAALAAVAKEPLPSGSNSIADLGTFATTATVNYLRL